MMVENITRTELEGMFGPVARPPVPPTAPAPAAPAAPPPAPAPAPAARRPAGPPLAPVPLMHKKAFAALQPFTPGPPIASGAVVDGAGAAAPAGSLKRKREEDAVADGALPIPADAADGNDAPEVGVVTRTAGPRVPPAVRVSLAIVVPFRDHKAQNRSTHLRMFLEYMPGFLAKCFLNKFKIFIIQQADVRVCTAVSVPVFGWVRLCVAV